MKIALWIFPASDLADWLTLVGESECESYQDYLTLIAAVQADNERQGYEVVRVDITVAEMKQELTQRGLSNTPDNRASVTALQLEKENET